MTETSYRPTVPQVPANFLYTALVTADDDKLN